MSSARKIKARRKGQHLRAVVDGPVFHIQGTREELLQLRSVLTLICAEEMATDADYERAASIGGRFPGQMIGVWEVSEDAPDKFTVPALAACKVDA